MKSLVLILALVSYHLTTAQTYSVLHVIGKIAIQETGEYLSQGSKIELRQNLKFETPGARAAVLSPDKGRYIIQAPESQVTTTNQVVTALTSVLRPVSGRMSTRAAGINNPMDLAKQLGEEPVAWINEELAYAVSLDAFPVDDSHFFFVRYRLGGEIINKKLENRNDSLVFRRTALFQVDNKSIDPALTSEYQLFYYDSNNQSSQLITAINWNIVPPAELDDLIASLSDLPEVELPIALEQLVYVIYGKCTPEDIQKALQLR